MVALNNAHCMWRMSLFQMCPHYCFHLELFHRIVFNFSAPRLGSRLRLETLFVYQLNKCPRVFLDNFLSVMKSRMLSNSCPAVQSKLFLKALAPRTNCLCRESLHALSSPESRPRSARDAPGRVSRWLIDRWTLRVFAPHRLIGTLDHENISGCVFCIRSWKDSSTEKRSKREWN